MRTIAIVLAFIAAAASADEPQCQSPNDPRRPKPPSSISIAWVGEKSGCDSGNNLPCVVGERVTFVAVPSEDYVAAPCDLGNFTWFAEGAQHLGSPSIGLNAAYTWDVLGAHFVVLRYQVNGYQNAMTAEADLTISEPPGKRHRSAHH